MTCGIGVALIGLMLVIGFGLVLIEKRRNKVFEEYRESKRGGHIPPWPMPAAGDMPPPPPPPRNKDAAEQ